MARLVDVANRMDRIDIDDRHLVGQGRLARQRQRFGGECGFLLQRRSGGVDQRRIDHRLGRPCWIAATMSSSDCDGVLLAGIPAHERIGVVRGEEPQPLRRQAATASPARRSRAAATAPAGWRHRRTRNVARLRSPAARVCRLRCGLTVQPRRQFLAVAVQQPHRDRNDQRLLVRLSRRRLACVCADGQRIALASRDRSRPRP